MAKHLLFKFAFSAGISADPGWVWAEALYRKAARGCWIEASQRLQYFRPPNPNLLLLLPHQMMDSYNSDLQKITITEKSQSTWRWLILLLGCLMMIGSYYCFDIPAALKTQIDDYMGDPDDYEIQFGLLYTLYSAPNVILPFFGGYLVDRFGVRMSLLLFSSLIAVGQVIFSIGLSIKSWPVIFLGRLVFGFGGESFTVANSALLADWFKGKELALAFGINLSISKLGSVINNLLSPILAEQIGITFALWFGAMLCGFGIVCVLLTMPIDRHLDQMLADQKQMKALTNIVHNDADYSSSSAYSSSKNSLSSPSKDLNASSTSAPAQEEDPATFKDVLKLKHIFWVLVLSCVVVYGCVLPFNNISSSLLLERDYFKEPNDGCQLQYPDQCQGTNNPPVNCPTSKWYQPPLPTNYSTYDPLSTDDIDCTNDEWKDGCTKEYCTRLTDAETQSSFVMSIPYIISAALSPPVGFLVDVYGFRAVIAAIAPAILIIVHAFLGYSKVSAVGPLVGQGLAYTGFVSVLWPSVPLVVEEKVTGLAFGIVTSMQNLATAIIPLIVASIYSDSDDKYIPNVELLFVILGCVGLFVGLYLNYYDMNHGHLLNGATPPTDYDAAVAAGTDPSMLNPLIGGSDNERSPSTSGNSQLGGKDAEQVYVFRQDRQASSEVRQRSVDRRTQSRGGSFSAYEEIMRGGAYKTPAHPQH